MQLVAAIGRGLDLSVIGEGIETVEQEQAFRAIGREEGQEFRYGKPVSRDALAHMLAASPARQAWTHREDQMSKHMQIMDW